MENLSTQSSMIKARAFKLGFDGCGIARADMLKDDVIYLNEWLSRRYHAGMAYMKKYTDVRADPSKLVEGACSVISLLLNYYPDKTQIDPEAPVVAKYAYGRDYHKVVKNKLRRLLNYIDSEIAPVNGRVFVDSAPVLQKAWAARAGLGWIGKNTCLIAPQMGSFCFIGTMIVNIPLHYDEVVTASCGDCTLCMEACPTQAIVAPRVLDARLCIAYLTIENQSGIPEELAGKLQTQVFGCDICQDVCPWNHRAVAHQEKDLEPLPGLLEMSRFDWHKMDEEQFNKMFKGSAVKRTGFAGMKRNLDFIKPRNF